MKTKNLNYDGWNVIEERRVRNGTAGSVLRTYVWGEDLSGSLQGAGGVGGLLTQMEKTDTTNWSAGYYHYDGNGNVATVSGPFRAIIAKFSYDGFGRTVTQTGAKSGIDINSIAYRFSTKPMELELATANTTLVPPPVSSGLYYYGYRFYSPNLGRWISRDPIREKGGRNLYSFVGNDGVDKLDRLGNKPCSSYDKIRSINGKTEGRSCNQASPSSVPPPNGCGAEGSVFPIPQSAEGVDFVPICNLHDTCYSTCKSKRLDCDNAFGDGLANKCKSELTGWKAKYLNSCLAQAAIYKNMVRLLGYRPYEDAQDDACVWECCEK